MTNKKEVRKAAPQWFYYVSILTAFLFTIYISIYSAIHFESIRYMNVVVVFLFITIVSFFLISGVYFHTEKMGYHALAPILFFAGMVGLIFYSYNAVDASGIVRYSIMYTIIVAGISLFILLPKKKSAIIPISKPSNKSSKKPA
ncbi:hypothetical protein HYX00_00280 [Candidatus Woesearchaeota archaeon]|nr:hypothetical protein [Candidatus Woesearchaeota archaeon]